MVEEKLLMNVYSSCRLSSDGERTTSLWPSSLPPGRSLLLFLSLIGVKVVNRLCSIDRRLWKV